MSIVSTSTNQVRVAITARLQAAEVHETDDACAPPRSGRLDLAWKLS